MRKIVIFILLFSLFVFTGSALADGHTMMEKLSLTGGLSYNTFAVVITENGTDVTDSSFGMFFGSEGPAVKEAVKSGMGFFIGGIYPLNEMLGIEFGYDSATGSYDGPIDIGEGTEPGEFDNAMSGIYAGVNYKLNKNFNVKGLLTSYNLTGEGKLDSEDEATVLWKANGIGALVGGEFMYMLQENANLVVNLAYRYAVLDVTEGADGEPAPEGIEFDGSGIRLGVGVNLAF